MAVCSVMIISHHRKLDISEIFLLEYNDPHYIRHSMMHACAGFNRVPKTTVKICDFIRYTPITEIKPMKTNQPFFNDKKMMKPMWKIA